MLSTVNPRHAQAAQPSLKGKLLSGSNNVAALFQPAIISTARPEPSGITPGTPRGDFGFT